MRKLTLVLGFLLVGGACTSAAAPEASTVIDQSKKATTVQVESTLRNAATAEQTYFVDNQVYTADLAVLQQTGFNLSAGVEVRIARADATDFCIDSDSAGEPMHVGTPDLTPVPGACA